MHHAAARRGQSRWYARKRVPQVTSTPLFCNASRTHAVGVSLGYNATRKYMQTDGGNNKRLNCQTAAAFCSLLLAIAPVRLFTLLNFAFHSKEKLGKACGNSDGLMVCAMSAELHPPICQHRTMLVCFSKEVMGMHPNCFGEYEENKLVGVFFCFDSILLIPVFFLYAPPRGNPLVRLGLVMFLQVVASNRKLFCLFCCLFG